MKKILVVLVIVLTLALSGFGKKEVYTCNIDFRGQGDENIYNVDYYDISYYGYAYFRLNNNKKIFINRNDILVIICEKD